MAGRIPTGSLRQRGNHWVVRVPGGTDHDGSRIFYQETLRTKRAASARRDELLDLIRKNPGTNLKYLLDDDKVTERVEDLPAEDSILLAREYFADWLNRVQHRVRPRTLVSYKEHVAQAMEIIGDIPITEVTTADIERVYAALRSRGWAPKTVLNSHRILRAAFTEAVEDARLRPDNPVVRKLAPKPSKFEIKPPSPDEVKKIFSAADSTPYGPIVRLAALTGMRLGELLALSWNDVDLQRSTLHIRASTTKTQKGRVIDLDPQAVELLRQHQRRQKEEIEAFGPAYADKTTVFANGVGKRVDSANLQRAWRSICNRAGVKYRFHDLRHLHASELLRHGVHPKVVQERLGHASITMTLDTYSHLIPSMQREAINKIKLFAEKTGREPRVNSSRGIRSRRINEGPRRKITRHSRPVEE
jgi:integrase